MREPETATVDPTAPTLQIGEVAARTALSVRTIRHWEQMGLLRPSARSRGGFRLYSEEDVARIRLLRFMKPLNFTLDQMRELLEIREELASRAPDADDRVSALVWPQTSPAPATSVERAQLAAALQRYIAGAEERLDKLRQQVREVEEFVERLREEARHGDDFDR